MKQSRFLVFIFMTVFLSTCLGGLTEDKAAAGSSNGGNARELLKPFTEAIDLIEKTYVDKVTTDKLVHSGIRGMLRVLDPHSTFFDKKEFTRLREEQHSKYSGLGIRVRSILPNNGRVVIYEPPFAGSPAAKKGLRAGDIITRINNQPIDDWTLDDVVGHLKGPRGTSVHITVERPGLVKPLEVDIERAEIALYTVPYAFRVRPTVGYIKIERFSESTTDEMERKLREIEKESDQPLSALILDLRDNHGGLLNEGVEVTDRFIAQGEVVVVTKGRDERSRRIYTAPGRVKKDVPLVVLINSGSASASEIVAGAIQDHDRGLIIGETSFGKGLVQSVYPLDNGSGLALTTAKWYTPSGRLIQRDYSGSPFDYLFAPKRADKEKTNGREIKFTDTGRKVYGGGGITPDVVVPAKEAKRFERMVIAKDIFLDYSRRLVSGKVLAAASFAEASSLSLEQAKKTLQVNDAIIEDFKHFLQQKTIEFTDKEVQDSLEFIKRGIRREVFIALFGLQEGQRIAIEGDEQVLKAIELIPEADKLMKTAKLASAREKNARP